MGFVAKWKERRRITAFLKEHPNYTISPLMPGTVDPHGIVGAIEKPHHFSLGMPEAINTPVEDDYDKVAGLDPLNAPKTMEEFYQQIDSDTPWTWDRVRRNKCSIVVDEITTT